MDSFRTTSTANSFANDVAPQSAGVEMSTPSFGLASNLSRHVCNVQKTTGAVPPGLVGPSTTVVGDKLYVFGGRRLLRDSQPLSSRLYELDLIQRHWTRLDMSGDIPSPRYFHSMCALGDAKLVCYGGMAPAPDMSPHKHPQDRTPTEPQIVVMADVHILDIPTRRWTAVAASNPPPGRYAHCAALLPSSGIFTSAKAHVSALQHNPGLSNQGSIGIAIDGRGGAEMVVVGGQDANSNYLESVCVFNLRSLQWTSIAPLGRSCGAYRSVATPLLSLDASRLGSADAPDAGKRSSAQHEEPPGAAAGASMLIYSNYNFRDVKLELQVRSPNGTLTEKAMHGAETPPGLRFPTGGIIDTTLVISGTFMTSNRQEYALWALDLQSLRWTRVDVGSGIFTTGSWNRGLTWSRRGAFVILGDRRRRLADDYQHRRINFGNLCVVELEAFGLYENPCQSSPISDYVSRSASVLPSKPDAAAGGRALPFSAQQLGRLACDAASLADMDILTISGERVPVNSQVVSRRWGPYFAQLLRESTTGLDNGADAVTLRPGIASYPSRNSALTITPHTNNGNASSSTTFDVSAASANGTGTHAAASHKRYSSTSAPHARPGSSSLASKREHRKTLDVFATHSPSGAATLDPALRPRVLYLPHTYLTVRAFVHYLYTSALPPLGHALCTPQILCSLLQIARPYRVDGLLEATVERLHQIPDARNAPAVFNAAAMAAGSGDGVTFVGDFAARNALQPHSANAFQRRNGAAADLNARNAASTPTPASHARDNSSNSGSSAAADVDVPPDPADASPPPSSSSRQQDGNGSESEGYSSATTTTSSASHSSLASRAARLDEEIWTGEPSAVVGLQLRGLRGLLQGRRLRERGMSEDIHNSHSGGGGNNSMTASATSFGTSANDLG